MVLDCLKKRFGREVKRQGTWLEKAYDEHFNPSILVGRLSTPCAPIRVSKTFCTALA